MSSYRTADKTCRDCGQNKPLSAFPESHPGKPRTRCDPCYRAYRAPHDADYYERHREEILASAAEFRDTNRAVVRERNRQQWHRRKGLEQDLAR